MKASESILEFIARQEGFIDHAYKPVAAERFWTIGFGHYGPDVRPGMRITRDRAFVLLRRDVGVAEAAVNRLIAEGARFTQSEFDALASFAFNCGTNSVRGGVRTFALAHQNSRIPGVMMLYVHGAGGVLLSGLVRRRSEESAIFRSGAHVVPPRRYAYLTPRERAWCRNWDRGHRSREQRAVMVRRRKLIWHLAKHGGKGTRKGWDVAHRRERYHALLSRTGR